MSEKRIRSTYSQAPFKISAHDHVGQIATGTGFHYLHDGNRFIITNWHNITGRDFFSRKNLNLHARTPLWIEVHRAFWLPSIPGQVRSFTIVPRRIEIYRDPEAQLDPLWLVHPQLGDRGCDIVAIADPKIDLEPEFMHHSVNLISDVKIPVIPGELAFVIGFPRGLHTGFGLPIWKSTFIASEPSYDVQVSGQNLPAFFLDGYTREGMSGSPVFARYTGMWDTSDPYRKIDPTEPGFWSRDDVIMFGSQGTEFVGIYSGRIPEKEGEAALGLCWRKEAISDVCSTYSA